MDLCLVNKYSKKNGFALTRINNWVIPVYFLSAGCVLGQSRAHLTPIVHPGLDYHGRAKHVLRSLNTSRNQTSNEL